ncbi:MAG: DUF2971 domain-containing protein, partial [Flavobacteriales bacterium]|nr:DUF2971 domain-containing protein [Flavobacteriales bacterium]
MEENNPLKEAIKDFKTDQYLKQIPKIIYKYRNWDDTYNRDLLFKKELYFASSSQFNDPFDCNIPFIYKKEEFEPANIFLKHYNVLRQTHPNLSDTEIHELVYENHKNKSWQDESFREKVIQENNRDVENSFGILSLTSDEKNFLMWSHYTNSHTGFCVGFDSKKLHSLCDSAFEPVTYQKDIPELEFGIFSNNEISNFLR